MPFSVQSRKFDEILAWDHEEWKNHRSFRPFHPPDHKEWKSLRYSTGDEEVSRWGKRVFDSRPSSQWGRRAIARVRTFRTLGRSGRRSLGTETVNRVYAHDDDDEKSDANWGRVDATCLSSFSPLSCLILRYSLRKVATGARRCQIASSLVKTRHI